MTLPLNSTIINFRKSVHGYPTQFWLIFWGMLISTIGASMIWPFLMIYASSTLNLPLTNITILMTLNSMVGLIFGFLAGPLTDRLGRKWIMVIGLAMVSMAYLLMNQAHTYQQFAFLMCISGAFNPLYRIGADAMVADLIPAENRMDAYSLLRMGNNLGISIGPAIGGFIASASYATAFYCAAGGLFTYSLLIAFFAKETLQIKTSLAFSKDPSLPSQTQLGGYRKVLQDRPFIYFVLVFTITQICAALIWVLLGIYAKSYYQVPEWQYGWIPATNALMVVLFQFGVTQLTKRYPPLPTMAVGTLIYGISVGAVAMAHGFWGFWISMVIMTIGELILMPTSNTYTANLAPADMRGRYMSIYGLTWGVAAGIGPFVGGMMNDSVGPKAPWIGGMIVGIAGSVLFMILSRVFPHQTTSDIQTAPAPDL